MSTTRSFQQRARAHLHKMADAELEERKRLRNRPIPPGELRPEGFASERDRALYEQRQAELKRSVRRSRVTLTARPSERTREVNVPGAGAIHSATASSGAKTCGCRSGSVGLATVARGRRWPARRRHARAEDDQRNQAATDGRTGLSSAAVPTSGTPARGRGCSAGPGEPPPPPRRRTTSPCRRRPAPPFAFLHRARASSADRRAARRR